MLFENMDKDIKTKKDFYDILSLKENASEEEIKKKYRKLAKNFHPNINKKDPKANEKFIEIQNAYDEIINPDYSKTKTIFKKSRSNDFNSDIFGTLNLNSYKKFNTHFKSKNQEYFDKPSPFVNIKEDIMRKKVQKKQFRIKF